MFNHREGVVFLTPPPYIAALLDISPGEEFGKTGLNRLVGPFIFPPAFCSGM
nr:MAG TPA: hypothetical protein [Caudoviricetes sp.]